MGTWYEMLRSSNNIYQLGVCGTSHYTQLDDGRVEIFNSEFVRKLKKTFGYSAKANCSKLTPSFCGVSYLTWPEEDFHIVSTDYTGYTIVNSHSYFKNNKLRDEYMWVLTREPLEVGTPKFNEMKKKTTGIIHDLLPWYDTNNLKDINQDGSCKYNPKNKKKLEEARKKAQAEGKKFVDNSFSCTN